MSFGVERRPRLSELSLTPLIDVVLNLLVFFMLSATFTTSATLEVKLPAADAPARPPGEDDVVVRIGADGRVMHEGVVVDGDQLRARLRHARRSRTDAVLIVQADGEAAHRHVVGVMAVARDAGFVDVGIAVDPTVADERVTP